MALESIVVVSGDLTEKVTSCHFVVQEGENRDLASIQHESSVLSPAKAVRRLPVGDRKVGVLPVPPRVGPVESTPGGGRGAGLRPRHHRGRNPPPVPGGGPVAGDLAHGGGARRRRSGVHSGPRGGYQPLRYPAQPVGHGQAACAALPPSDRGGRRHVASAEAARGEAGSVLAEEAGPPIASGPAEVEIGGAFLDVLVVGWGQLAVSWAARSGDREDGGRTRGDCRLFAELGSRDWCHQRENSRGPRETILYFIFFPRREE